MPADDLPRWIEEHEPRLRELGTGEPVSGRDL
jgi:hypothetical protein